MSSLSKITADAFAWRLLTEASRLTLIVSVQVLLARILPVEAFGVLAIAMLVVNFGTKVSEVGMAPALIQREHISPMDVRVAFSISVITGSVLSAAIWLTAPTVARLFDVPTVAPILRLVGLLFVAAGVATTAEALLQRAMEYRRLMKVEVISYAVGFGGIGIAVAVLGYGVFALAWATLAQVVVKSVMLVALRPHPKRVCLARREMRDLLHFGIGVSLSRLAAFAAENGDKVIVGRWLGTVALGLYSRALQLMYLPITQFSAILNDVLFPAYSSIQADKARMRRGYLESLAVSAIVVFPTLTMLAIPAPELLAGVLGDQWAPAAVPFQILAVGGAGYCIYNLSDSLVRANGAVYMKFFYQSIYAICVLAAALIGRRWGISGVSVGMVAAIAIAYLLMARLSLHLIDCTWRRFFFAQWPGVVVSCVAASATVPVVIALREMGLAPLAVLAGSATVFIISATSAVFLLPRRWLSQMVVALLDTMRGAKLDPRVWQLILASHSGTVSLDTPRTSPLR